jgi:uroporphyrinogen-III synthase
MSVDLPLAGLKIVVTRPRDQALKLAQAIEQAGGIPLLRPLLEILPVQDGQTLNAQVLRLSETDLAIFISPNAVRYGMEAIRATLTPFRGRDSAGEGGLMPPAMKVASPGPGTTKALNELGVHGVIVPTVQFDSEGLLALPDLQSVAGWRVMIFRGDGGRELLGDALKARGAVVEYVTCYRRGKSQLDVGELSTADAIIVTSSEALEYLCRIAQGAIYNLPLFVPHPRIAELARVLGWRDIHLTDTGDEGVLLALKSWGSDRIGKLDLEKGDE